MLVKAALLSALCTASATAASCSTKYASTSVAKVSTTTTTYTAYSTIIYGTTTKTIKGKTTATSQYQATATSTVSKQFIYTSYLASTTTTVPASSGYTPLISAAPAATLQQRSVPDQRRDVPLRENARAASTTKYPASVICETQIYTRSTHYDTVIKYSSTATHYVHSGTTTQTTTKYSTTSVLLATPTAEVPFVCQPDNIISTFPGYVGSGSGIENIYLYGRTVFNLPCTPDFQLQLGDECRLTGSAANTPLDCCIAAWQVSAAGFSHADGACAVFRKEPGDTWEFFTGFSGPTGAYYGNIDNVAIYGGTSS